MRIFEWYLSSVFHARHRLFSRPKHHPIASLTVPLSWWLGISTAYLEQLRWSRSPNRGLTETAPLIELYTELENIFSLTSVFSLQGRSTPQRKWETRQNVRCFSLSLIWEDITRLHDRHTQMTVSSKSSTSIPSENPWQRLSEMDKGSEFTPKEMLKSFWADARPFSKGMEASRSSFQRIMCVFRVLFSKWNKRASWKWCVSPQGVYFRLVRTVQWAIWEMSLLLLCVL